MDAAAAAVRADETALDRRIGVLDFQVMLADSGGVAAVNGGGSGGGRGVGDPWAESMGDMTVLDLESELDWFADDSGQVF